jgi:hypothetical protein
MVRGNRQCRGGVNMKLRNGGGGGGSMRLESGKWGEGGRNKRYTLEMSVFAHSITIKVVQTQYLVK